MDKLRTTDKFTIYKPGEGRIPPALEEFPSYLRKMVIWAEDMYADIAGRINWLLMNTVEDHSADDTLTEYESPSIHSNLGATSAITLTLPTVTRAGIKFTFAVQAAAELRIDPAAATIRDDVNQTVSKYTTANAIGEALQLISNSSGDWIVIAKYGTWTKEA